MASGGPGRRLFPDYILSIDLERSQPNSVGYVDPSKIIHRSSSVPWAECKVAAWRSSLSKGCPDMVDHPLSIGMRRHLIPQSNLAPMMPRDGAIPGSGLFHHVSCCRRCRTRRRQEIRPMRPPASGQAGMATRTGPGTQRLKA
jgi:hypothetical protein